MLLRVSGGRCWRWVAIQWCLGLSRGGGFEAGQASFGTVRMCWLTLWRVLTNRVLRRLSQKEDFSVRALFLRLKVLLVCCCFSAFHTLLHNWQWLNQSLSRQCLWRVMARDWSCRSIHLATSKRSWKQVLKLRGELALRLWVRQVAWRVINTIWFKNFQLGAVSSELTF